jgi:opine dehydrogenase
MTTTTRYTVIGAGHGGKAMAAHLALMGFPVTLYNRTPDHIAAIAARSGIELESWEGGPRGFGHLALVTSEMHEALAAADVVMVVVPSSAHVEIATIAAPYLRDGQIVVLHPGRTCGSIAFAQALAERRCLAEVIVAEAETFIYASRSDGPAQARIFRIKEAGS